MPAYAIKNLCSANASGFDDQIAEFKGKQASVETQFEYEMKLTLQNVASPEDLRAAVKERRPFKFDTFGETLPR